MEDPQEETKKNKIRYPTIAYDETQRSIVYRLSELMFGSLLASYILGFIGFEARAIDTERLIPWLLTDIQHLLEALQYIFISVTFAYVTAGLYVSYHAGILTMPQRQFKAVWADFLLAIMQAVLFGVVMLEPSLFVACLGVLLVIVFIRKEFAHRELREFLYSILQIQDPGGPPDKDRYHRILNGLLKTIPPPLRSWCGVSWKLFIAAFSTLLLGIVLEESLRRFDNPPGWILLLIHVTVMVIVGVFVTKVVNNAAKLFSTPKERAEVDKTYRQLLESLKEKMSGDVSNPA